MKMTIQEAENLKRRLLYCIKHRKGYVFKTMAMKPEIIQILLECGWKPVSMKGNRKSRIKRIFKEFEENGMNCETFYNSQSKLQIAFLGTYPGDDESKAIRISLRIFGPL